MKQESTSCKSEKLTHSWWQETVKKKRAEPHTFCLICDRDSARINPLAPANFRQRVLTFTTSFIFFFTFIFYLETPSRQTPALADSNLAIRKALDPRSTRTESYSRFLAVHVAESPGTCIFYQVAGEHLPTNRHLNFGTLCNAVWASNTPNNNFMYTKWPLYGNDMKRYFNFYEIVFSSIIT